MYLIFSLSCLVLFYLGQEASSYPSYTRHLSLPILVILVFLFYRLDHLSYVIGWAGSSTLEELLGLRGVFPAGVRSDPEVRPTLLHTQPPHTHGGVCAVQPNHRTPTPTAPRLCHAWEKSMSPSLRASYYLLLTTYCLLRTPHY